MTETPAQELEPRFGDVQYHYDLSDEFYRLFLDPSQTYSCAYFERDDMTLEEAQMAKIDMALGKLRLRPGMTLLDIGCGWGATMMRALWKHDVNVVGLTLSKNQALHVRNLLDACESVRSKRVLLEGWEQFYEPVDRIVSIGAFEHFGAERYGRFFGMAHDVLPPDGSMLLHTIIRPSREDYLQRKLSIRMRHIRFARFISREIFPGGELPQSKDVIDHASVAGFTLERVQSLRMHYARTLECWAAALERNRDRAVAIQSQEVYERYMKYLTGCVELFRKGYIDICQFTLAKSV